MRPNPQPFRVAVAALLLGAILALVSPEALAQKYGPAEIGGVVRGPKGPEAGVWVIAETVDLPTGYAKVVVTDDKGRYLIPELPKAVYKVWVRGYGLVDSAKVPARPGMGLDLRAVPAPSEKAAAEYYPGMYWYSLLKIPDKSEFPGTGEKGNGISPNMKAQHYWIDTVKHSCQSCHALGSKGIRTVPDMFAKKSEDGFTAWARRTQSGQAMTNMALSLGNMGPERALKQFADWTDRIAAGELPFAKPERPKGIERNVVVTMWNFSQPQYYLHDGISSYQHNPRVNANGPIYGSPEESTDLVPVLDPVKHTAYTIKHPVNPGTPSSLDPADAALAALGRQADLGRPQQHPQQHDGCRGARLVQRAHPPGGEPGLLQGGLGSSVGESRAAQRVAAPAFGLRPEDARNGSTSTRASARITFTSPRTPTARCGSRRADRRAAWSAG